MSFKIDLHFIICIDPSHKTDLDFCDKGIQFLNFKAISKDISTFMQ